MDDRPKPAPTDRLVLKILRFPLTRLILALVFVGTAAFVSAALVRFVAEALSLEERAPSRVLLAMVAVVLGVHVGYWLYVRLIEWRSLEELSPRRMLQELGAGILVGAGLFSLVIGVIWACGSFRVVGTNPWSAVIPVLAMSVIAGYAEEVFARGIIFRIVEDGLGTWISLFISAALFGLLHMGNDNATWVAGISIAATAGLLLGAAYVLTRRLWLAIGIHFAWNFTQGGIFGVAVSGNDSQGVLVSELSGHELIAGGPFGAEASIFTILLGVPLAIVLLVWAHRRDRFVRPMWSRRRAEAPTQLL